MVASSTAFGTYVPSLSGRTFPSLQFQSLALGNKATCIHWSHYASILTVRQPAKEAVSTMHFAWLKAPTFGGEPSERGTINCPYASCQIAMHRSKWRQVPLWQASRQA